MKSGYDQFFQAARQANKSKPTTEVRVQKKRVSDDELEKRLRRAFRLKSKTKARVPLSTILSFVGVLALTTWYSLQPDWFHSLYERIEVRAFGSARASSEEKPAKSANEKADKAENSSSTGPQKNATAAASAESGGGAQASHFNKLNERSQELDQREKELNELEEELQRQKVEVEARVQRLEEMRREIASVLKERMEADQEKVNKLVEFYSNMKPKQAADIIGTVDDDLAVDILTKMKKKNAAEILNLLTPEKAKTLSEKFTGYRRR